LNIKPDVRKRIRINRAKWEMCVVNKPNARPNFFIVGAPKCGTTAMNDYLAAHPDIFMAPKELHYFGSDLQYAAWFHRKTLNEYLAAFSEWRGQKRIGEASVWYLYSQQAAQEIKTFAPDARIIIMLRNPVDMLYSNYHQFLYNGNEDLPTFKEALEAEADRKRNQRLPRDVSLVQGLYYRETAAYTDQVRRYFDLFGREAVQVIIFDDFKNHIADVYRQTLEFLEVDPSFAPTFQVINPNKRARSTHLRALLNAQPNWYRQAFLPLARRVVPQRMRRHLRQTLRNLNTEYVPREPLEEELRAQLQREFLPEVKRLSELLGRDLMHWCQP
jgi:hypothetical protein